MTYMFGDSDVVAKVKHTDRRCRKTWAATNIVTGGPALYYFICSSLWHFPANIIISTILHHIFCKINFFNVILISHSGTLIT